MPRILLLPIIVALLVRAVGVHADSANFVSVPLEKANHQTPSSISSAVVSGNNSSGSDHGPNVGKNHHVVPPTACEPGDT